MPRRPRRRRPGTTGRTAIDRDYRGRCHRARRPIRDRGEQSPLGCAGGCTGRVTRPASYPPDRRPRSSCPPEAWTMRADPDWVAGSPVLPSFPRTPVALRLTAATAAAAAAIQIRAPHERGRPIRCRRPWAASGGVPHGGTWPSPGRVVSTGAGAGGGDTRDSAVVPASAGVPDSAVVRRRRWCRTRGVPTRWRCRTRRWCRRGVRRVRRRAPRRGGGRAPRRAEGVPQAGVAAGSPGGSGVPHGGGSVPCDPDSPPMASRSHSQAFETTLRDGRRASRARPSRRVAAGGHGERGHERASMRVRNSFPEDEFRTRIDSRFGPRSKSSRSPRTRSPRTRSPRTRSPRTRSPRTSRREPRHREPRHREPRRLRDAGGDRLRLTPTWMRHGATSGRPTGQPHSGTERRGRRAPARRRPTSPPRWAAPGRRGRGRRARRPRPDS